ncbi:hypothetical protein P4193_05405 [Pseudomonas aeruginosa]|uniref:hypothetical protein n=1 Tax=Pseudomonas aeruginosa TaxID=287 RepID=UPI0018721B2F|nr:hypothetical protein [Pseudomonas aeruginosa]
MTFVPGEDGQAFEQLPAALGVADDQRAAGAPQHPLAERGRFQGRLALVLAGGHPGFQALAPGVPGL